MADRPVFFERIINDLQPAGFILKAVRIGGQTFDLVMR